MRSQGQPGQSSILPKEEAINISASFNSLISFLYTVQMVVTGKWLFRFFFSEDKYLERLTEGTISCPSTNRDTQKTSTNLYIQRQPWNLFYSLAEVLLLTLHPSRWFYILQNFKGKNNHLLECLGASETSICSSQLVTLDTPRPSGWWCRLLPFRTKTLPGLSQKR